MKNKVLVEISIPHLDKIYNVYLPLNKNVANIIILIEKAICDIENLENISFKECSLYNSETALPYPPNTIIRTSNIRNGTKLILI